MTGIATTIQGTPHASRLQVSCVVPADYSELAAFLASFPDDETGSAGAWLDRMRAWWDLNPAFEDSMARGWVLRYDDRIVGFFGSIPRRFRLGGRETTVFASTTWRVLPEYRGTSMALKRRQMDEQQGTLHFSTTPRSEVVRLLELLGYTRLPRETGWEEHSIVILNFRNILRARLRSVFAGGLLAAVLAPVLGAYQYWRLRRLRSSAHDRVREVSKADTQFDELWDRTKTLYENTNVRAAADLDWYCVSAKGMEKKLLGYYEDCRLRGYLIFLARHARGATCFECVDLWIEPGDDYEAIFSALVEKGRRIARTGGADRLELPHFDARARDACRRQGLIARQAGSRPEYFRGPPGLMTGITPSNSYFVLAQGDYGL